MVAGDTATATTRRARDDNCVCARSHTHFITNINTRAHLIYVGVDSAPIELPQLARAVDEPIARREQHL
jgi:hypothetical protein